jgi:hypothetical protein
VLIDKIQAKTTQNKVYKVHKKQVVKLADKIQE